MPDFAQNGKEDITIRQLLTHYSGLAPDIELTPAFDSKESAFRLAFSEAPTQAPGSGFISATTYTGQVRAGNFPSVKFAGRAPDGHLLARAFLSPGVGD